MTNKLNSLGTVMKVSENGSKIQNSIPFNLFVKGYSIQQIQQGIKDSFGIDLQTEEIEYKIKRYHVEHRMQVSKQEIMAAQRSGMKNSQIQAMLHMKYGVYFTVAEIRQIIKEYKLKNRRK